MSKVIKETEAFEETLKNMEYLQLSSTDLFKYARDVNCHFASKKCRDVIVAARKFMTSKMHNTVKVRFHQQSRSGLHRKLRFIMYEYSAVDAKDSIIRVNYNQLLFLDCGMQFLMSKSK